ncbi:hypothetical protein NP233_g853 [Leucocoprinus birnbaumii]|uniref:Uncharacterized protein n=1 Tax=Leucocoprinus birnbaumii TaxID=56174 RepID=A0AAD5W6B1_9AGAR|nr:hypothetical protein NP233_g853 [Leucocoprinus birnbaumii]
MQSTLFKVVVAVITILASVHPTFANVIVNTTISEGSPTNGAGSNNGGNASVPVPTFVVAVVVVTGTTSPRCSSTCSHHQPVPPPVLVAAVILTLVALLRRRPGDNDSDVDDVDNYTPVPPRMLLGAGNTLNALTGGQGPIDLSLLLQSPERVVVAGRNRMSSGV